MSQPEAAVKQSSTASPGAPKAPDAFLARLLDAWWRARFQLAILFALGTSLSLGLLLLIPNQYRAESRVIVLPPRFLPEVRTEPLTVATANELLGSFFIMEQVLDAVRLGNRVLAGKPLSQFQGAEAKDWAAVIGNAANSMKDETIADATSTLLAVLPRLTLPELETLARLNAPEIASWTIDDLARWLKNATTVEQRTAVDIKLSPLIKLTATSDSPATAQLLANVWAIVFEQAYDYLSTTKTRRQYDSILNQQRQGAAELEAAQEALVEFKRQHNIDLYLRQIEQYTQDFQEQSRQLLSKQNALRTQSGNWPNFWPCLPLCKSTASGLATWTAPRPSPAGISAATEARPHPHRQRFSNWRLRRPRLGNSCGRPS